MNEYPEEILVSPSPLIAVLSDGPFLNKLVESLKSCSSAGANATGVILRYEAYTSIAQFAKKERTHGDYDKYVPSGLLRSNWLRKHADLVPAVLVSCCWPMSAQLAFVASASIRADNMH